MFVVFLDKAPKGNSDGKNQHDSSGDLLEGLSKNFMF